MIQSSLDFGSPRQEIIKYNFSARRAMARNADPITSLEAADSVEDTGSATAQRNTLYAALLAHPGATCGELAARVGLRREAVSKRLPELRKDNMLQHCQQGYCKTYPCNPKCQHAHKRSCFAQSSRQLIWWIR